MNELMPRLLDAEVAKRRRIKNPDRLTVLPARELIKLAQAAVEQLEAEVERIRLLQVEADAERARTGETVRYVFSPAWGIRERLNSLSHFRDALSLLDPEESFTLDPEDVDFFNLSGHQLVMPAPAQFGRRRATVRRRVS